MDQPTSKPRIYLLFSFLCLFPLTSETPKTPVGSLSFQNRLVGLSLSRRASLSSESSEASDAGKTQGPHEVPYSQKR